MMAVDIGGSQFTPDTPETLFQTNIPVDPNLDQNAVSRDGQRFIMLTPIQESGVSSFNIVLN